MTNKKSRSPKKIITLSVIFVVIAIGAIGGFVWLNTGSRGDVAALVGNRTFNFVRWEVDALLGKAEAALVSGQSYLDDDAEKQLVVDYLSLVSDVRRIDGELNTVFANSDNPEVDSAELQTQLAAARAKMDRLQPLAEEIVQTQVGSILDREGFDILSATWPPVQMHMTPLPLLLIVSPRDRIEQIHAFPLQHGMSVPDRDLLEQQVFDETDLSALVVPIGGLAVYPAMIIETSNLVFLADVVAHEWAHHWLTLRPLGIRYNSSGNMRTINETVASVVGVEVGLQVLQDYYPDFVPEPLPPPPANNNDASGTPSNEPPPFDFRAEMAETRIEVDLLLLNGEVESAETYMEERRQLFVENGFNLRKLNQAYFAFFGAYADSPGATGSDPIGPGVVELRTRSESLRDFLETVGQARNLEEFNAILDDNR